LSGWLGDCALEIGGDVDSAIWAVYLERGQKEDDMPDRAALRTRLIYSRTLFSALDATGVRNLFRLDCTNTARTVLSFKNLDI